MTVLAGFVDALGYTAMGHLYLSFMSGNSTQFGMAVAGRDAHVVGWAGAVIATFVLGAFLGSLVSCGPRAGWNAARTRVRVRLPRVGLEPRRNTGHERCTTVRRSRDGHAKCYPQSDCGAATGKSFITGALFGVGDALARACLGRARFAEAGANAVSWLTFVAGVTCGALVVGALGIDPALQVAAGLVLVLMTLSILWRK
jgi:uncharacterized membrane protein YoaK (UPF0700 family)